MNARERTITFDDGASTILETWGTGGPNVVCLHGITSSRKSFARTAGAMELAYTVHAYDQRGHGDAAGVKGPMTLARSVRDCAEVADAIPGGIDTLIGHSWGGAVAILAGLELPVSRVVAIDPMFHVRRKNWEARWSEELREIFAAQGAERERAILKEYAEFTELDLQGKIHALAHMTLEPILRIGSENGADEGGIDLRETVVNYPKPLLLLLADPAESVVHPDDVAFIREHGGPRVTTHVFSGQGHSLHRTAFDEYMQAVNAFVGVPV